MSKKKKKKRQLRNQSAIAFLATDDAYNMLCAGGYTRLDRNPEIVTGCRKIAELISNMTIYLMANTDKGDERIKNEMSRKIDIEPNRYQTRKTWIDTIVMNLLLHGSGNSVVRIQTDGEYIGELIPVPPANISFVPEYGWGYHMNINGIRFEPEDVMHFVLNPDPEYPWRGQGITTTVKEVAENLQQARKTEKGFMSSKYKPSLIVKVDGITDEFSTKTGRKKILEDYVQTSESGEPWLLPAEQFDVEQIKPLSLSDLAINDTVEIDKRTVAAILGVPAFVLGVGSFDKDEWNNFIKSTIGSIATLLAQEMTRKLLLSPKWYWKFNVASLFAYDLQTTASVYGDLHARGIVDGNEVRDKLSMQPREGLDELVILENYIPISKTGDQLKLKQGEEDG